MQGSFVDESSFMPLILSFVFFIFSTSLFCILLGAFLHGMEYRKKIKWQKDFLSCTFLPFPLMEKLDERKTLGKSFPLYYFRSICMENLTFTCNGAQIRV